MGEVRAGVVNVERTGLCGLTGLDGIIFRFQIDCGETNLDAGRITTVESISLSILAAPEVQASV